MDVVAVRPRACTPWLLAATLCGPGTAVAQENNDTVQFADERGGARARLSDAGIDIRADLTGYLQQSDPDLDDDAADYGRFDLFVDFNAEKLGLWSGGMIRTHSEIRMGDVQGSFAGALLPSATAGMLPLGRKDRFVASSVYLAQQIGERSALLVGKINVLDLLEDDPVLGGWGIKRFQHIAFVAPPSGVVPPTLMGAVFVHNSKPVSWTFMVMGPNDRTSDYWVDGLFDEGVNFSIGPTWTGTLMGRPSTVGLTAGFSTARGQNLDEILLPEDLRTGDKKGSYNIALATTHRLRDSIQVEGKGLDLYLEAAVADGNPNPIQGSFTFGLAGHGMVTGRPHDSFGIGGFWFNFSNDLQKAVDPLVRFNDEKGLEAWYNMGVTPWFHLSADLQLIDPASGNRRSALVAGLRANVVF